LGASGSTGDMSGSAEDNSGSTLERRQRVWERLKSPKSSLGKATFSLGTLLVRQEIIATAYRSTIFTTHVFSLYSHLGIYVPI